MKQKHGPAGSRDKSSFCVVSSRLGLKRQLMNPERLGGICLESSVHQLCGTLGKVACQTVAGGRRGNLHSFPVEVEALERVSPCHVRPAVGRGGTRLLPGLLPPLVHPHFLLTPGGPLVGALPACLRSSPALAVPSSPPGPRPKLGKYASCSRRATLRDLGWLGLCVPSALVWAVVHPALHVHPVCVRTCAWKQEDSSEKEWTKTPAAMVPAFRLMDGKGCSRAGSCTPVLWTISLGRGWG